MASNDQFTRLSDSYRLPHDLKINHYRINQTKIISDNAMHRSDVLIARVKHHLHSLGASSNPNIVSSELTAAMANLTIDPTTNSTKDHNSNRPDESSASHIHPHHEDDSNINDDAIPIIAEMNITEEKQLLQRYNAQYLFQYMNTYRQLVLHQFPEPYQRLLLQTYYVMIKKMKQKYLSSSSSSSLLHQQQTNTDNVSQINVATCVQSEIDALAPTTTTPTTTPLTPQHPTQHPSHDLFAPKFPVSLPPHRSQKVLHFIGCMEAIRQAQQIVVVVGAGLSVAAGIPDFRSPQGLYKLLQGVDLSGDGDGGGSFDPTDLFNLPYFAQNPVPFYTFYNKLGIAGDMCEPTFTHRFLRLLEQRGKLLRVYTQNIDNLEEKAGIQRYIACHGNDKDFYCINCHLQVPREALQELLATHEIPRCQRVREFLLQHHQDITTRGITIPSPKQLRKHNTGCNGLWKPSIVFFGENLPSNYFESLKEDMGKADLILVIGTSLTVQPVASIPNIFSTNHGLFSGNKLYDALQRVNNIGTLFQGQLAQHFDQKRWSDLSSRSQRFVIELYKRLVRALSRPDDMLLYITQNITHAPIISINYHSLMPSNSTNPADFSIPSFFDRPTVPTIDVHRVEKSDNNVNSTDIDHITQQCDNTTQIEGTTVLDDNNVADDDNDNQVQVIARDITATSQLFESTRNTNNNNNNPTPTIPTTPTTPNTATATTAIKTTHVRRHLVHRTHLIYDIANTPHGDLSDGDFDDWQREMTQAKTFALQQVASSHSMQQQCQQRSSTQQNDEESASLQLNTVDCADGSDELMSDEQEFSVDVCVSPHPDEELDDQQQAQIHRQSHIQSFGTGLNTATSPSTDTNDSNSVRVVSSSIRIKRKLPNMPPAEPSGLPRCDYELLGNADDVTKFVVKMLDW